MVDQAELSRPVTKDRLQTINPANGEPGASYEMHTIEDAQAAAAAAHKAFQQWRRTSFSERATMLRNAAEILRERQDEFARLMTDEMGKTFE